LTVTSRFSCRSIERLAARGRHPTIHHGGGVLAVWRQFPHKPALAGRKPRYHRQLMLAPLAYSDANRVEASQAGGAPLDKSAAEVAELTAQAEAADAVDDDPCCRPRSLDASTIGNARFRLRSLEAAAKEEAENRTPRIVKQQRGLCGQDVASQPRPPKPHDQMPPPDRQTNLIDPGSQLIRKSILPSGRERPLAMARCPGCSTFHPSLPGNGGPEPIRVDIGR
jgi:hypothetical protein